MLELRPYQKQAIADTYAWLRENEGAPVMVLPVGSGKSLVMAELIRDACQYDGVRVLVLAHVKELLEQNHKELKGHWPAVDVGIYSAGLKSRDLHNQVLIAGIQSIYKKAFDIGKIDLCLVDEAHLISRTADTMYGRFLRDLHIANPKIRIIGLTATDYRLDSGRLTEGKDRFFHGISHETSVRELIDDKYLCWITSKRTVQQLDTSGVTKRGGEFVPGELEKAVDLEEVTRAAVKEIVTAGADRKAWLIFCAGVIHAVHVRDELREHGVTAEVVTGDTPNEERDDIIARYKRGEIKALCNVNCLTTGFNVPFVDMEALLRPTESAGLYVQMIGRLTRNYPGKKDGLVLDFAGNIERHGPIDCVQPKGNKEKRGEGEAPVKACPQCQTYCLIALRECPDCGYEFPPPEIKISKKPDESRPILQENLPPEWVSVHGVSYHRHEKAGKQPTMRVEYRVGMTTQKEWICFEHSGYAGQKASLWWYRMGGPAPCPQTVQDALFRIHEGDELNAPSEIQVRPDGKFVRVTGYRFPVDTRPAAGDERDTASEGSDGSEGTRGREVERIWGNEEGMGRNGSGNGQAGEDCPF